MFQMNAECLYGLPLRSFKFNLDTTETTGPYRLFNQDLFPHKDDSIINLYSSVPYLTAHSEQGDQSVAWINAADTWVDIKERESGRQVSFTSEAGVLELFLFAGVGPDQIHKKLADITGYPQMPPAYALGFHFSKWGGTNAHTMMERNKDFTKFKFQVDVLWFDIDHTQDFEYFQFHRQKFSESQHEQMNAEVRESKRKFVVITDPHLKVSTDYVVYADAVKQGVVINNQYGNPFVGDCWPGKSVWVDFLNQNAQQWWQQLMQPAFFNGTTSDYAFWIDMNEPSVFGAPTLTVPLEAQHKMADGRIVLHRDVHNMYGTLQHKTVYQGMLIRDNDRRPFVLTRAFWFGSQKYGAYWTGDNNVGFREMQATISMLLASGLSGLPFGGADIPSFAGEHTDHTLINSYQLGIFMPFFRAHSHINNPIREPWLLSERAQEAIHQALDLRYSLFHYLYTQFYFSSRNGMPIWRPLWYSYSGFPKVENQFLFGSDMLVCPKVQQKFIEPGQEVTKIVNGELIKRVHNNLTVPLYEIDPVLPDYFYNYNTKEILPPGQYQFFWPDDQIPLFIKQGTILVLMDFVTCLSLEDCYNNTVTIEVYLNQSNEATGTWYVDDGVSTGYGKVFLLEYKHGQLSQMMIQDGPGEKREVSKVIVYSGDYTELY